MSWRVALLQEWLEFESLIFTSPKLACRALVKTPAAGRLESNLAPHSIKLQLGGLSS